MNIEKVTIGADPELFIVKNGSVVSSIGLIPGVKNDPFIPKGFKKGYGVETDNILAEFNIPPAKSEDEFANSIALMKQWINDFVRSKDVRYTIECTASRHVSDDQLQSDEAKQFGCDPDYNAYTEEVNPKPEGAATNLRSAGFHIHVGYPKQNYKTSVNIIKWMDAYLGVPSIILDRNIERRQLYGKAGAFRLQPWGVEYRVLSSYMMSNDRLTRYVYRQTMAAVSHADTVDEEMFKEARDIINSNDIVGAQVFCKKYNIKTSLI